MAPRKTSASRSAEEWAQQSHDIARAAQNELLVAKQKADYATLKADQAMLKADEARRVASLEEMGYRGRKWAGSAPRRSQNKFHGTADTTTDVDLRFVVAYILGVPLHIDSTTTPPPYVYKPSLLQRERRSDSLRITAIGQASRVMVSSLLRNLF
ncbi:unnamed protein product [Zymoseptoria tritici ST99CH_1E4]|uniref:Uncharacterized protein n=1 Tax=Zymoseptoria tritici ST99CH_1E4 TaxID=1276532 RepID=A0A2H1H9T0_ZYMTR|nr:unnamed protein product [Zymoseptoria tritici ST99CH_1E4]